MFKSSLSLASSSEVESQGDTTYSKLSQAPKQRKYIGCRRKIVSRSWIWPTGFNPYKLRWCGVVVACVVVEVKVQQRRPDGGSIPPIARIVLLFCLPISWQLFCLQEADRTLEACKKFSRMLVGVACMHALIAWRESSLVTRKKVSSTHNESEGCEAKYAQKKMPRGRIELPSKDYPSHAWSFRWPIWDLRTSRYTIEAWW